MNFKMLGLTEKSDFVKSINVRENCIERVMFGYQQYYDLIRFRTHKYIFSILNIITTFVL